MPPNQANYMIFVSNKKRRSYLSKDGKNVKNNAIDGK